MAKRSRYEFGSIIRTRRRELDLTLAQVAERTKTSAAFIGHLESGARRPSDKVLGNLAAVLRLDTRQLFLLANPGVAKLIKSDGDPPSLATWDALRKSCALHRANKITSDEMRLLSKVAKLGDVQSERDFIFVLIAVRQAIGGSRLS